VAATVTDLVAPQELSAAVALNSAAFNVARAVGPHRVGIILARTGAGAVFLLNALILYWSAYRSLSLEGGAKGEHTPGRAAYGRDARRNQLCPVCSIGACRFGADVGLHPVRQRALDIASFGRQNRNETRPGYSSMGRRVGPEELNLLDVFVPRM